MENAPRIHEAFAKVIHQNVIYLALVFTVRNVNTNLNLLWTNLGTKLL